MRSARVEFEAHVGVTPVLCAIVSKGDYDDEEKGHKCLLKVGYSPKDYETFLKSLEFNYDNGYGGQELYGTIWFKDGTYSDRGEYDGSEWWEFHRCPQIPAELA